MKKVLIIFSILLCFPVISMGAKETLVLNSSYSPPHSTTNQTGYLDLIVKEAFLRAGLEARIQTLPAERSLQDSNAGISDGEIGRIAEIDQFYPNLVIVDEPIIESRDFVAFSIDHVFKTDDWKSLKPYHVGIVRGWKFLENNIVDVTSLIRMDSTVSLFKLLKNKRADVVVNARIDGLYTSRILGVQNIKVMEPPLASVKLYLFLHEKHRDLVPKLEKALKKMKRDKTFYKIRKKVLNDIPD
jgi:polar amino acid transport system substrate-binding protein